VYEICAKIFLKGTFTCTTSFLACARHTTCVRVHIA